MKSFRSFLRYLDGRIGRLSKYECKLVSYALRNNKSIDEIIEIILKYREEADIIRRCEDA